MPAVGAGGGIGEARRQPTRHPVDTMNTAIFRRGSTNVR